LNSRASLSSILSAPSGHSPMQAPRPSHNISLITFALPSIIAKAPSAHDILEVDNLI